MCITFWLANSFFPAESLAYASAVSILLAVVFVAVSLSMVIYAIWQGKTQNLRLMPDITGSESFFKLFTTIPVFATGLACHVTSKCSSFWQSHFSSVIDLLLLEQLISYKLFTCQFQNKQEKKKTSKKWRISLFCKVISTKSLPDALF